MKKPDSKTVIVLAAAVTLLAAIGVYSHRETLFAPKEKAVKQQSAIVTVEKVAANSTVRDNIVQNMSIEAVNRVQLLPRVTGRLEKLWVKQGGSVAKGQTIATLEHEQQDALIGSAQAETAAARADSERAKAEMMNAKTNLDRYKRLVKEGFSTQQQYDSIETAYTSAKASYNAALAKEKQVQAELGRVRSSRGDYIITAPISGVVLNDYSLTTGAMISPSSPIVDLADLSTFKATLKIPESKIFAVTAGMPVTLRFDALPGEEFQGAVSRIDQYVDPETRTSNVEIALSNASAGGRLRPGMFGQASVVEKEYKNAITVQEGALHSSDKGSYVFVVEDGRAKLRNVSTGIKEGNTIQIRNGLKPGEEVIVFGGNNLNDGDAVTLQSGGGPRAE